MDVDRKKLIREYKTTPRPAGVFLVRDVAERRAFVDSSTDLSGILTVTDSSSRTACTRTGGSGRTGTRLERRLSPSRSSIGFSPKTISHAILARSFPS